jgi:YegS/Rv2252/BmrU family lipid kinase
MKNRKAVLIANPNAGRGGAKRAAEIERFRIALSKRGVEIEVLSTTAAGHATTLAAEAAKIDEATIIVSGGDGTINEVLQGAVGTSARLGIWPRGTANVLAREIGMPTGLDRVVEIIADGKTRRIYPGMATNETTGARRYFFLMAGIGLDASVVERVNPGLKRRIGKGAFWFSGLGHLANWQPVPFEVEVDNEIFPATFAAVGKGSLYGGDLHITPRASLYAPEFEICLINSTSRLRYLSLLSRAMRVGGMPNENNQVKFISTDCARVTGNVMVQVDGELIGSPPMRFEVVKDPIELIHP